jgi:S1-C subfamily serine protease
MATSTDPLKKVRAAEQDRIEVMAQVAPSVVCIFKSNRSGGGAGVVITEDGYGLTNYHVVAPLLETRKGLGGMSDGQLYPLEVLGIDPTGDVAMFRLTGRDEFTPASLGDSDNVQLGDWVFAMGNPFGLSEDYTPGVTHGIVSGLHRYQFGAGPAKLVYTDCIQVDASINPGNSGGPLFDIAGKIIGINGRASFEFEQRGRVNVGVGYAVSINQIKRFIPHLRAGLLAQHGTLGATMIDLGYHHVAIEKMFDPSAAAAAGLRIGDRLRRFAGRDIHSSNLFANILGTFPAGWPISVELERDGQRFQQNLRLDPLPVRLKEPFELDTAINRTEAERVLTRAQQALGALPMAGTILYEGIRNRIMPDRRLATPTLQQIRIEETADNSGQYEVRDKDNQPIRTVQYDGRSAHILLDEEKTVTAAPAETGRLNLWLAARQALYTPLTDAWLERFRHEGGDSVDHQVGEVLRYDSPDFDDILISFNPQTHLPSKIRWRPIDPPSAVRPTVELELSGFHRVKGVMLPHKFLVFTNGEPAWFESYEQIRIKGRKP